MSSFLITGRSSRALYSLSCLRSKRFFSTVIDDRLASVTQPLGGSKASALQEAITAQGPRSTWSRDEIREIYNTPLMELSFQSAIVHRKFHSPSSIQMCTLMNIKTGGCSEDCSYCAQSSRYDTGLKASKMSSVDSVLEAARIAKDNGSTRFCMGAAWRDMRGRKTSLKNVKQMVEGITGMGMEACVTLGMIDEAQAQELKGAGLTAYNHNVDTSREHYPNVITTRSYDERLQTLSNVRKAGINVCSGGILGLGEKPEDHVGLLHTVSTLPEHPESFPVNALVAIKGTPMEGRPPIPFDAILRTIATARLLMPKTIIRIAAGRITMSEEQQVLCFMAGANAIFTGEKMLTTECNGWDEDKKMFEKYGLRPMKSYERGYLRDIAPEVASEQAAAEIRAAPKSASFTSLGKTSGLSATAPMAAPASPNSFTEENKTLTPQEDIEELAGPHRGFSSLDQAAKDMSKSGPAAGGYSTETLQQNVPSGTASQREASPYQSPTSRSTNNAALHHQASPIHPSATLESSSQTSFQSQAKSTSPFVTPKTLSDEVSNMSGPHRGFETLHGSAQSMESVGTSNAGGFSTTSLEGQIDSSEALNDAIRTQRRVFKEEIEKMAGPHRGFSNLDGLAQSYSAAGPAASTSEQLKEGATLPAVPPETPAGAAPLGAFAASTPTASATTLDEAQARRILESTIAQQRAVFEDEAAAQQGPSRGFKQLDLDGKAMRSAPDWSGNEAGKNGVN